MNYAILDRLAQSKFRASFKLKQSDIDYVNAKGIETVKRHAYDFVTKRLADISQVNDGKQTPTKGHPVFVAQHATATCCRGCLYKWHNISPDGVLSSAEIDYVVDIIMAWIARQLEN